MNQAKIPNCCLGTVDSWYQSFLARRGGHHSEITTKFFHESNQDLAPVFAHLLSMAVEFRAPASKSVGLASLQPLRCEQGGKHVALVILASPFMLLLFPLQAIFLSMIDNWDIIPETSNRYRERISWHEAGEEQVRQLVWGWICTPGVRTSLVKEWPISFLQLTAERTPPAEVTPSPEHAK